MPIIEYVFIKNGFVVRLQSDQQAAGATACNVWFYPSALLLCFRCYQMIYWSAKSKMKALCWPDEPLHCQFVVFAAFQVRFLRRVMNADKLTSMILIYILNSPTTQLEAVAARAAGPMQTTWPEAFMFN